jgi:hypothetical protein
MRGNLPTFVASVKQKMKKICFKTASYYFSGARRRSWGHFARQVIAKSVTDFDAFPA